MCKLFKKYLRDTDILKYFHSFCLAVGIILKKNYVTVSYPEKNRFSHCNKSRFCAYIIYRVKPGFKKNVI